MFCSQELNTTFSDPVPPAPMHQNSWVDSLSTSSSSSSLSLACDTLAEWSPREMDDFFASFITIPGKDKPSPLPEPMLPSDDVFSTMVNSPMETSRQHSTSDCDCLTTALDLLGKSDTQPDFSSSSVRQGKTPTETLISENQSVASAVDNILQCSCAQDSQVLIILALVVSKVLGRYGRAARVGPSSQGGSPPLGPRSMPSMGMTRHRPSSMTMAHIHGEDSGRAAGQLVLGELHRALKLVNELAARLNASGSSSGSPEWMRRPGSAGPNGGSSLDPTSTVSFSPSMLDQLGSDLREQLKAVVATITGMLQGTA
ncbi:hypothetical protein PRZ48_007893 [Zasmidium cellare]|uniref:Aflatoxin regulatory protein domain-containing protein n=1 Tax=Zasmidium cellare TaxID=395010 RepID=A0ABR0EKI9_ZASCE|nr:hypothetical protein PRZ48_007893 [Zasmidium cellare]